MTTPSELGLPPKVAPETLELRARPFPAVRLRKGLVVGLVGGAASVLALASWLALDPPSFSMRTTPGAPALQQAPTRLLENVPATYDELPVLGPPLAGNLRGAPVSGPVAAGRPARPDLRTLPGHQPSEITRSPPLFVGLAGDQSPGKTALAIQATSSTRGRKQSPYYLSAGTIIPASLLTGINSDLPGTVVALVTAPVHDSATGQVMLIPQGARLVGQYDGDVRHGHRRAFLTWNLLVLPDGQEIPLSKVAGADRAGYPGISDEVDFHRREVLEGGLMAASLGIGTELGLGDAGDGLGRAIARSTQVAATGAGEGLTRRNLELRPTITVRPGWPVRVILESKMALARWEP